VAAAIGDMKEKYPAMNPPRYAVTRSEDMNQCGRGKLRLACSTKKILGCEWHLNAYTSAQAPTACDMHVSMPTKNHNYS
jgi:hypothetical protein